MKQVHDVSNQSISSAVLAERSLPCPGAGADVMNAAMLGAPDEKPLS